MSRLGSPATGGLVGRGVVRRRSHSCPIAIGVIGLVDDIQSMMVSVCIGTPGLDSPTAKSATISP